MNSEISERTPEQEAFDKAVDAVITIQEAYLDDETLENLGELEKVIQLATELGLSRFNIEYDAAEKIAEKRNMQVFSTKVVGSEILTEHYGGLPHYTLKVKTPEQGTVIYTGNVKYKQKDIRRGHCRRFAEGFGANTWQLQKREVPPGSPRSWKRNAGKYSASIIVLKPKQDN